MFNIDLFDKSQISFGSFLLLSLLLFASCRGKAIIFESGEPIHLTENLIIEERDSLIIKPGAEILIDTGINILAYGNVYIQGTAENPITIKATNPDFGWGEFRAKSECKDLIIEHAFIEDGQFFSYKTRNYLNHVSFKTNQQLEWNDAVARFWEGSVLIENCRIDGINRGEGFLLHDVVEPIVRTSAFTKIPDAVEFIDCTNGQIVKNIFLFMKDDAIDQNSCIGTLISDNEMYYVRDCGMELGSEKFGSSDSLKVFNNLFIGCKKGIVVKESSFAKISQSTFYKNEIAIETKTPQDSTRSSKSIIEKSVFIQNKNDFLTDEKSLTNFIQSLSDSTQFPGANNLKGAVDIENYDLKKHNTITEFYPNGTDEQSLGFRKRSLKE